MASLAKVLSEVGECRMCAGILPNDPRPILQAHSAAKILIIGQAPGIRAHKTGTPWNDPSGARLRKWMQIDKKIFYDKKKIALIPSGLCYPGAKKNGGDYPPRAECAPIWHKRILDHLGNIELTLLVGLYAQKYYLAKNYKQTLSKTVFGWREFGPNIIPTPHPSWRVVGWIQKNNWFEAELLPILRAHVRNILEGKSKNLVQS